METECLVVDSSAALEAVTQGFPASFWDSVDVLIQRVARGCMVTLVRRPKQERGGKEIAGYNLSERGVFSALGRRKALSAEVVFAYHTEVLPASAEHLPSIDGQ